MPSSEYIYPNEAVEFDVYIVNEGNEKVSIPLPQKMASMPKSFVYHNIFLFNSEDSILNSFRCGVNGSVSNKRMPGTIVVAGGKTKLKTFKYTFSDTGSFKLKIEYFLDGKNKPVGSSIDYKSFLLKSTYNFNVVEKQPLPMIPKDVSYEEFKDAPKFSLNDKIFDSTNVFKLSINGELTNEKIATLKKFKNVRGLYISSQNPVEIPGDVFKLDLYDFAIRFSMTDPNVTVDLSRITKLTSLRSFEFRTLKDLRNNVILPKDLSQLESLSTINISGITNEVQFPILPTSVKSVSFANMHKLSGVDGDFSKHTKLGKMAFKKIDKFEMPDKIQGNIYRLSFDEIQFDDFPDISELSLASLWFIGYTGEELPDYFVDVFRNGSYIYFPKHLENSKPFKKLSKKKLKNRVFARKLSK